jgi:hypothetical protein
MSFCLLTVKTLQSKDWAQKRRTCLPVQRYYFEIKNWKTRSVCSQKSSLKLQGH